MEEYAGQDGSKDGLAGLDDVRKAHSTSTKRHNRSKVAKAVTETNLVIAPPPTRWVPFGPFENPNRQKDGDAPETTE